MQAMKFFTTLLLLAIPSLATAQTPCGGIAGVDITITPANAAPGEAVLVEIANNSNQVITLPTSCVFQSVNSGLACSSPVTSFFCLQVLTTINPGSTHVQAWDQKDDLAQQVPDGDYSFSVRYFDAGFATHTCCPGVTISSEPGAAFCAGVGCPCGNEGVLGAGCANSTGGGALLGASGDATVGSDTVSLNVSGVPAAIPGLFFGGPLEVAPSPFGDGLRCVGGSIRRLEVVFSDAAGNASTSVSLSSLEGLTGGELRQYQYWYRDISGPCNTLFNVSSAYRIQW